MAKNMINVAALSRVKNDKKQRDKENVINGTQTTSQNTSGDGMIRLRQKDMYEVTSGRSAARRDAIRQQNQMKQNNLGNLTDFSSDNIANSYNAFKTQQKARKREEISPVLTSSIEDKMGLASYASFKRAQNNAKSNTPTAGVTNGLATELKKGTNQLTDPLIDLSKPNQRVENASTYNYNKAKKALNHLPVGAKDEINTLLDSGDYSFKNTGVEFTDAEISKKMEGAAANYDEAALQIILEKKYKLSEEEAQFYTKNWKTLNDINDAENKYQKFKQVSSQYSDEEKRLLSDYVNLENMEIYATNEQREGYATQKINTENKLIALGWNPDQIISAAKDYRLVLDTDAYNEMQEKVSSDIKGSIPATLGYNAADLATFIPSGIAGGVETLRQTIGSEHKNPYASGYMLNNLANITEESTSEKIGNGLGQFGYGVVMSTAKSLETMAFGGQVASSLGLTGSAATAAVNMSTLPIFGVSAYQQSYKEGVESGLGENNATRQAFASGLFEMMFEMVSLDKAYDLYSQGGKRLVEKGFKQALIDTAAQAGIEGSEEGFTTLANWMADAAINGDFSEYSRLVEQYGKEEANRQYAMQLAQDVLAGAASGGLTGAGSLALSYKNARSAANVVINNEEALEEVKNSSLKMDEDSKAYKIASSLKEGENPTRSQVMDMIVSASAEESVQSAVKNSLIESGSTEEEADKVIEDLATLKEEELTEQETSIRNEINEGQFSKNNAADNVIEAVNKANKDKIEAKNMEVFAKRIEKAEKRSVKKASKQYEANKAKYKNKNSYLAELKGSDSPVTIKEFSKVTNGAAEVLVEIDGKDKIVDFKDLDNIGTTSGQQFKDIYAIARSAAIIEDTGAANIMLDSYNGSDIYSYVKAGMMAFNLGQAMQNAPESLILENKDIAPIVKTFTIPESYVKAMFLRGQNIAKSEKLTKAELKTNKKAEVNDKNVTNKDTDTYKMLSKLAQIVKDELGISVNLSDEVIENEQASFVASLADLNVNLTGNNPLRATFHELSEFAASYNPEAMAEVYEALIEFLNTDVGTNVMLDSIEKYKEVYRSVEANKTTKEASMEYLNDVMAGLFMNEEGMKQFTDFLSENKTEAEKKSIIQKIADFFNALGDFLKKMVDKNLGASDGIILAKKNAARAYELRDMWLNALKGASTELNNQKGAKGFLKAVSSLADKYVGDNFITKADIKNNKNSLEVDDDLYLKAVKKNENLGNLDKSELDYLHYGQYRKALANSLRRVKMFLPEDIMGNTIKSNASYGRTAENSLVCIRSLVNNNFIDRVADYIERPLTEKEHLIASNLLAEITGNDRECQYCYVATDRTSYNALFNKYFDSYKAILANASKNKSEYKESLKIGFVPQDDLDKNPLYKKFLNGSQSTKPQWERYSRFVKDGLNGEVNLKRSDLSSSLKREKIKLGKDLRAWYAKDAEDWSRSVAWPTAITRNVKIKGKVYRKQYIAYNGNILRMRSSLIEKLNSNYGLRMYSYSDYSPHFILENIQMVTDAAVMGLKMLAYTKDTDFAKIFAPTGMGINISCFGREDENGNIYEDAMQGVAWEEAKSVRDEYNNVGVVFVATSDNIVEWALAQDWIDVVIPYHLVKTGDIVASYYGFKNYSGEQYDKKKKGWTSNNLSSIPPTIHENNFEKYIDALNENNLDARFKRWIDNPNYMKLVNETRLSYKELNPVHPNFDWNEAMRQVDRIVNEGTYGYPKGINNDEELDNLFGGYVEKAAEMIKADPDRVYSLEVDSDGNKLTDNQIEFFKDSKVRDENGKLKVMYHGTPSGGFTVFNRRESYLPAYDTHGNWFTDDVKMAEDIYVVDNSMYPNGKMLYTVYLNSVNPLVVDAGGSDWMHITYKNKKYISDDLAKYAFENNYDGLIIENLVDGDIHRKSSTIICVFNSNQIKSVANENPTLDPDIRYSVEVDSKGRKLTENQKRFFADEASVFLDNGKLKQYYHGSPTAGFTEFDFNESHGAIFLTDSKDVAKSYSDSYYEFSPDNVNTFNDLQMLLNQMGMGLVEVGKDSYRITGAEYSLPYLVSFEKAKDYALGLLKDASVDTPAQKSLKGIYPTYVHATNPFIVECNGTTWNDLPFYSIIETTDYNGKTIYVAYDSAGEPYTVLDTLEEFDNWTDYEGKRAIEYNIMHGESSSFYPTSIKTRDVAAYAYRKGFDSVVFNNIIDMGGYHDKTSLSQVVVVFKPNQIKSIYNENPTKADDIRYSMEVGNYGCHAGDLGKSESLGNQTGRDTGHFGTGTYFVGNVEKINGYNSRDGVEAPREVVDFSKYNLFKPLLNSDGKDLHEFLKGVNNFRFRRNDEIKTISDLNYIKDYIYNRIYDYEGDDIADIEIIGQFKRLLSGTYITRAFSRYYNSNEYVWQDDEGLANDKDEVKTHSDMLSEMSKIDKYHLFNDLYEMVDDWRYESNIEKYEKWNNDFYKAAFILNEDEQKLRNLVDQIWKDIDDLPKSTDFYREDSASTRFMKALGYEGIDVRAISELDNTTFGSVIYDLKGNDLERKNEIGTARYSMEVENTSLPESKALADTKKILEEGEKLIFKSNVSPEEVLKIAKEVISESRSKYNASKLADTLTNLFRYLGEHKEISSAAVLNVMRDVASPVVDNIENDKAYRAKKAVRQLMKDKGIRLNSRQKIEENWVEICTLSEWYLDAGSTDKMAELKSFLNTVDSDEGTKEQQSYAVALKIFEKYYRMVSAQEARENLKPLVDKLVNKAEEYKKQNDSAYKEAYRESLREVEGNNKSSIARINNEIDQLRHEQLEIENDAAYTDEEKEFSKAQMKRQIKMLNEELDLVKKQKDENARKLASIKARRSDLTEQKKRTELRHQIMSNFNYLNGLLNRPKNKSFIPVDMVNNVLDVVSAINVDTGRSKALAEKLKRLELTYERYKNDATFEKDNVISNAFDYDQRTHDDIVELRRLFEGRNYTTMSVSELEQVLHILKALRVQINNANKLINSERDASITEMAIEANKDIVESRKYNNKFTELLNKYLTYHLNALRWFRKLCGYKEDSAWMSLYRDFNNGQKKQMQIEREINEILAPVIEGKKNQKELRRLISDDKKDLVDIGIRDENNNSVLVTRDMRLSLIMHLQNESNEYHVLDGGLKIPNIKEYTKGKNAEAYAHGDNYRYIPKELRYDAWRSGNFEEYDNKMQTERAKLNSLYSQLSDWEKDFLKKSQEVFWKYSGDRINETSAKLKGYAIARVKNYYPIRVDSNFTVQEISGLKMDATIEGRGFLKERIKSGKPMYLEGLTNVLARQIKSTADYAGMAIPVRNMNMVINKSVGKNGSVRGTIEKTWGVKDVDYLKNLMRELQGNRPEAEPMGDFIQKLRGNFAAAVFTLNPSVAIRQAASFPTAAAVLGYRDLAKTLVTFDFGKANTNGMFAFRKGIKELEDRNPLLWYRSKGYNTQELGDLKKAAGFQKYMPAWLDWITMCDVGTVRALEYASVSYVNRNYKDLTKGSTEYWDKVSEVFTKAVEETQPNYAGLQRADVTKRGGLVQYLVMFKTQAFQNLGILYDATGNLVMKRRAYKVAKNETTKAELKVANNQLAHAITSQLLSAMIYNMMGLIAGAILKRKWKDYEDEEGSLDEKKILATIGKGSLETMAGMFILGSDIYNAINAFLSDEKYYGTEVQVLSTANDLVTNLKSIYDNVEDSFNKTTTSDREKAKVKLAYSIKSFVETLGMAKGIPVSNLNTIILNGFLYGEDLVNNEEIFTSKLPTADDILSQKNMIIDAMMNGSDDFDALLDEQINERMSKKEDASEEEVTSSVLSSLKTAIKTKYLDGEIDKDKAKNLLKTYIELSSDEAAEQIIKWNMEKAKGSLSEDYSIDEYIDAIDDVGLTDEKEDAKIKSEIKTQYDNKKISDTKAKTLLKKELGYDDDKAYFQIESWKYGSEYGQMSKLLDKAVNSGSTNRSDLSKLVKEYKSHGKEGKYIASYGAKQFKDQYLSGSKRANIKSTLINLYMAAYDISQAEAQKKVEKVIERWNKK